jgi:branched-chain amino acid transport system ATP-binding protein
MPDVLSVERLSKSFAGLDALKEVSFAVAPGLICGLIGPNGAGKTTLLSIVAGAVRPTAGMVRFLGRDLTGAGAVAAARAGIARTHQVPRPFRTLSVLENVEVGCRFGRAGRPAGKAFQAAQALAAVGLAGRAEAIAGTLSVGDQKRLELARCLAARPSLLLCDEVCSGLTAGETAAVLRLLCEIRDAGTTILYVEHNLQAILSICDHVVVLDHGQKLAEGPAAAIRGDAAVIEAYIGGSAPSAEAPLLLRPGEAAAAVGAEGTAVVGRAASAAMAAVPGAPGAASQTPPDRLLAVEGLEVSYGAVQVVWGVDVEVGRGEVVGILGPNGAGKTTTLRALAGLIPVRRGRIVFAGRDVTAEPAHQRVRRHLCLVPEGRQLWPRMSVEENLLMGAYPAGFRAQARQRLARMYELFPRLLERRRQACGTLSGGEQQMCAIARGLMAEPLLLLLDEPSLGLAPIAAAEVFALIRLIAAAGVTILLVAQNADLALQVADRGYVMESGRVTLAGTSADLRASDHVRGAYLAGAAAPASPSRTAFLSMPSDPRR